MKTYDNYVYQIGELLKERHICRYSRIAHEKCYLELREYIISSNLDFFSAKCTKLVEYQGKACWFVC